MVSEGEKPSFDQRNQDVETQHNIANLFNFHKYPTRSWLVLSTIILIFVAVCVTYKYVERSKEKAVFANVTVKNTVDGLNEFDTIVNSIIQSYEACEKAYSKGEFIFARELKHCRDGVSIKLSAAQDVRSKYAPSMHVAPLNLIDELMQQNMQDFSSLSDNEYLTNSFEDGFVRSFVLLCSKEKNPQNAKWNDAVDNGLSNAIKLISNIMFFQNKEYYIIRDFVLPRLYNSREILADTARTTRGLDSAKVLAQAKASYQNLIGEQNNYKYEVDNYPFQNGKMRRVQQRDYSLSSAPSTPNGIKVMQQFEDSDSSNAKMALPFMALRGRYEEAKKLVDCGILKPEFLETLEK